MENTNHSTGTAVGRSTGSLSVVRRISWGAVLAGVVIVLVTQLFFAVLGISIGAGVMDPLNDKNPVVDIGVGTGVWFGVSTLVALFVGGWVSGRMANLGRKMDSTLHGILA